MLPGDRLVCIFITPQPRRATFQAWPLHITLVPWFRVGVTTATLRRLLKYRLRKMAAFTITVGAEAHFGYRQRKTVNLIEQLSPLPLIENAIRTVLHEHHAWIVDEAGTHQLRFRPHISVLPTNRVHFGDEVPCARIAIVEQMGRYKKIIAEIALQYAT